jgi:polyisoprenoid-binding protein YceI
MLPQPERWRELPLIRRFIGGALPILATLAWPCSEAAAAKYTIDTDRTVVRFETRYLGIATQTGIFHVTEGGAELDPHAGSGHIDIVVDARTVDAGSEAMENFLRGPALLNVDEHPQFVYRADRVVFDDGKPERIEGQLTLVGVTQSVALDVSSYHCTRHLLQQRCVMLADASFQRSAFGLTRYRAFAGDSVKLAIRAEAVRVGR